MDNGVGSLLEFLLDFTEREYYRLKMYRFGLEYGSTRKFTDVVFPLAVNIYPLLGRIHIKRTIRGYHRIVYPFMVKASREGGLFLEFRTIRDEVQMACVAHESGERLHDSTRNLVYRVLQ